MPGVEWTQIVDGRARSCSELLGELGLVGWPKTSGSRGIHVNVRIQRALVVHEVRRAALALAREVERRAPKLATSKWWKEERHGVFLDYNQNAKDRTVASAYSVRPKPDARVSAPLTWDELDACQPEDFTLRTMPARFAAIGDRHARIDDSPGSLEAAARAVGAAGGRGAGRRALAAALREAGGRAAARAAVEAPRAGAVTRRAAASPRSRSSRSAARRAKKDALLGLERWKARHPEAAARLEPADVLVDSMRGRSSTWTRVRVNLEHVPEELRPPQEPLDPDYDPWRGLRAPPPRRAERPREALTFRPLLSTKEDRIPERSAGCRIDRGPHSFARTPSRGFRP